jgi:predicted O-methyltransferase YrrM
MLPVMHPDRRDVVFDAAKVYARIGRTLCETPAHVYLDGLRTGGAIHKDEVWVLQHLIDPATVGVAYVIGAAFGFSSVVLALQMPRVRVVTIDNWSEGRDAAAARAACDTLSAMPEEPGPRLVFATGESPRDTASVLAAAGVDRVAVALIDGLHTNDQLIADIDGVVPHLDDRALVLLHDVRLFDLWEGVRHLAAQARFDTLVQLNTSTGMVAAFNRRHHPGTFAFLQETQVVAHWHPDRAAGAGATTSYPALARDAAADARELRYDTSMRQVGP